MTLRKISPPLRFLNHYKKLVLLSFTGICEDKNQIYIKLSKICAVSYTAFAQNHASGFFSLDDTNPIPKTQLIINVGLNDF